MTSFFFQQIVSFEVLEYAPSFSAHVLLGRASSCSRLFVG